MRFKSLTWIFIPFVFAALHLMGAAQVATTPVTDTIYHADGTTATGTVLPADPTSALQAATKQYVDSVAGSGGSGLSGQTVNYLPVATCCLPGPG